MTDYKKYINALRKCAKEHENDRTSTGHIIVSDLCKDTANLLKELDQEPCEDCVSRKYLLDKIHSENELDKIENSNLFAVHYANLIKNAPPVTPQEPKTGHWKAFIHNAYHGTDEDGEPIGRKATVYNCSQCNRRTVIKEKYCPNCGARMVEPQAESEVEDGSN